MVASGKFEASNIQRVASSSNAELEDKEGSFLRRALAQALDA